MIASCSDEGLGTRFPDLRRAISGALFSASPDGYRLGDADSDADVKAMIASESQRLSGVLSGYPLSVADAKVRAAALQFRSSCRDEVGFVLSVLAASVRPGGRILEIGTGAGVGTAWIAHGLDGRTDVEVVSLEIEPMLCEAVRQSAWPPNIAIVNTDATMTLSELGGFELVFADAAPVKYGNIEAVVSVLNPGGILVIDDLLVGEYTTEKQLAEKDELPVRAARRCSALCRRDPGVVRAPRRFEAAARRQQLHRVANCWRPRR